MMPWRPRYECSGPDLNAGYASPVRTPGGRDSLASHGQLESATEQRSVRERMALRAMAMTD